MMQNNLKSSRSFQLNDLIEHQRDRKLPSASIHLQSANTHEYFIKLLLFKYKSGQNALLLLTVNADGTQCCRTALLSCVRQHSHQLQKPLHWVTAVASNTSHLYFHANPIQHCSVTRLLLHSLGEGKVYCPLPALKSCKILNFSVKILQNQGGLEANVILTSADKSTAH